MEKKLTGAVTGKRAGVADVPVLSLKVFRICIPPGHDVVQEIVIAPGVVRFLIEGPLMPEVAPDGGVRMFEICLIRSTPSLSDENVTFKASIPGNPDAVWDVENEGLRAAVIEAIALSTPSDNTTVH